MYKLMTDEEREYVELLHDVQMKELQPLVQECDEKGLFPMSVHDKLGELGFHGMDVPEEYGGLGLSSMANYFIREELGYELQGLLIEPPLFHNQ